MKKTIRDVDLEGKKVLMRVDFNVPLDENQNITDDSRIKAAIPTIKYVQDKGAKVILMSHLGRPKGKLVDKMRLKPIADRLSELIDIKVSALKDCVGDEVRQAVENMKEGEVVLLENLRFHKEEESNDPNFAKELSGLGDVFVNDAFGTAHRAHASTEGVTKHLPSIAGFLMEKEIEYLGNATVNPEKPFVIILGGAKVSDKIGLVDNLLNRVDSVLIGGGMAYTFLKAKGINIGSSKLEEDKVKLSRDILNKADSMGVKVLLPVDHLIVDKIDKDSNTKITDGAEIPDSWIGVDVGPETIKLFKAELAKAKTIVWNGPLGIFEIDKFDKGSREIAQALAESKATTVIGGGDTAACVAKFKLEDKMTHISTGGGASLEYLEGKVLPGIAALGDK